MSSWEQGATWIDRAERGVRTLLYGGALTGLLAPKLAIRLDWFRDLTFSLWIADDAYSLCRGDLFKGSGSEKARDGAQVVMNSIVAATFWAPKWTNQFAWMEPTSGAAWIATSALNVHIKDGSDRDVAIADTFYAVALCCNVQASFNKINLRPVELCGLASGALPLYVWLSEEK